MSSMQQPRKGLLGVNRLPDGSISTVGGFIEGSLEESSPIIIDSRGTGLGIIIESLGAATLRFCRSINNSNPANQAALEAGSTQTPDYSNIRFMFVDFMYIPEPGLWDVLDHILTSCSKRRYTRITRKSGASILAHTYGS